MSVQPVAVTMATTFDAPSMAQEDWWLMAKVQTPLTWTDLERWHAWRDTVDDWRFAARKGKPRQVDPRLLTIAPTFVGLFDGLARPSPSAAALPAEIKRLLLKMMRNAVGSLDSLAPNSDWQRAHVVCDWMLRSALPAKMNEQLPRSECEQGWARRLMSLQPLLWTTCVVEAIATMTPIWFLIRDRAAEGTAGDRRAYYRLGKHSENVTGVLAQLLTASFRYRPPTEDWLCIMAMEIAFHDHRDSEHDLAVLSLVSQLVDVLLAVQEGDSQSTVADRCEWSSVAELPRRASGGER